MRKIAGFLNNVFFRSNCFDLNSATTIRHHRTIGPSTIDISVFKNVFDILFCHLECDL